MPRQKNNTEIDQLNGQIKVVKYRVLDVFIFNAVITHGIITNWDSMALKGKQNQIDHHFLKFATRGQ